ERAHDPRARRDRPGGAAPHGAAPRPGGIDRRCHREEPPHGARPVKAALRKAWESRAPRERVMIAVLAAVLGAASYLLVVVSADRARGQLRTSVATLRTQAAALDQQAA